MFAKVGRRILVKLTPNIEAVEDAYLLITFHSFIEGDLSCKIHFFLFYFFFFLGGGGREGLYSSRSSPNKQKIN